jgi:hypothetical protein
VAEKTTEKPGLKDLKEEKQAARTPAIDSTPVSTNGHPVDVSSILEISLISSMK